MLFCTTLTISSGFSLYDQEIIGQTPCYSILPQTFSLPTSVSDQISSLSSLIAATATVPNPTVSVHIVTDEVFALSLPLKNGVETVHKPDTGLSSGAKIGIGVGAALGAIIAITLIAMLIFNMRKDKRNRDTLSSSAGISAWAAEAGTAAGTTPGTGTAMSQRRSLASTATAPTISNPAMSPPLHGHTSYADDEFIPAPGGEQQQQHWQAAADQQYYRMPPPRAKLQPMPTATPPPTTQTGTPQSRYSELPGTEYVAPVEADGREAAAGWSPTQQQQYHQPQQSPPQRPYDQAYDPSYGQTYGQAYGQGGAGAGQGQNTGAGYAAYAPRPDPAELDSQTQRPPRWMQ